MRPFILPPIAVAVVVDGDDEGEESCGNRKDYREEADVPIDFDRQRSIKRAVIVAEAQCPFIWLTIDRIRLAEASAVTRRWRMSGFCRMTRSSVVNCMIAFNSL